jgi:hypothetical protein
MWYTGLVWLLIISNGYLLFAVWKLSRKQSFLETAFMGVVEWLYTVPDQMQEIKDGTWNEELKENTKSRALVRKSLAWTMRNVPASEYTAQSLLENLDKELDVTNKAG